MAESYVARYAWTCRGDVTEMMVQVIVQLHHHLQSTPNAAPFET